MSPCKFLNSIFFMLLQTKQYLLKLGRFHRHAGIPSDYLGVMGSIFVHAVRYFFNYFPIFSANYYVKIFITFPDPIWKNMTSGMKKQRTPGGNYLAILLELWPTLIFIMFLQLQPYQNNQLKSTLNSILLFDLIVCTIICSNSSPKTFYKKLGTNLDWKKWFWKEKLKIWTKSRLY